MGGVVVCVTRTPPAWRRGGLRLAAPAPRSPATQRQGPSPPRCVWPCRSRQKQVPIKVSCGRRFGGFDALLAMWSVHTRRGFMTYPKLNPKLREPRAVERFERRVALSIGTQHRHGPRSVGGLSVVGVVDTDRAMVLQGATQAALNRKELWRPHRRVGGALLSMWGLQRTRPHHMIPKAGLERGRIERCKAQHSAWNEKHSPT